MAPVSDLADGRPEAQFPATPLLLDALRMARVIRSLHCYRGEMPRKTWGWYAVRSALAAVTVAALAGCGGQDTQQPTPTPMLEGASAPAAATATPARQAVGGDRTEPASAATEEPRPKPTPERPSDEQSDAPAPDPAELQYLRDVCLAEEAGHHTVVLTGSNQSASDSVDEPGGYERLNVEPLRRLVHALRSISPPDELAVYHDAAVAEYEELLGVYEAELELIESGATVDEASDRFGSYFVGGPRGPSPPLPPRVRDRLGEAATSVPECSDSGTFLFFFLGVHVGGPAVTGGPVDPADEAYVRSLCIAGNSHAVVVDEAVTALERASEIDESDVEAYLVAILQPSRDLASAMREIPPPDDVADYHAAFVEGIEDEVAWFDNEEMVALLLRILQTTAAGEEIAPEDLARLQPEQESLTPALSSAQRGRLAVARLNVVECYHNGLLYEFLGLLEDLLSSEDEDPRASGDIEEIPVGGSVEGTLDVPEEEDMYWFGGEEGETYFATTVWEGPRSLFVNVTVTDGGNSGTGGGSNAQPLQLQWTATKSGPVYVSVKLSGTVPGPVSYTVSILPSPVPKTPTNARYVTDGSVMRITWDAVEGADYYNVYYSDSSDPYCSLSRDGTPASCDELATNLAETTYLHVDPDKDETTTG